MSGLLSIHEYGGRKPKECLSAMSFAFQSEEFTARYAVPSFERWLEASDKRPAYRMHRLVSRSSSDGRPRAWVLKSPVHLHDLPTLFETYPDARVAITHRDPLTLLASLTSLIANLRWAHSDEVDEDDRGRPLPALSETSTAGRLNPERDDPGRADPPQPLHRLPRAPIETIRGLYARFGIAWSSDADAAAMRAALAANPSDRHGEHVYSREDLGGDPEQLALGFARYRTEFGVPSDG